MIDIIVVGSSGLAREFCTYFSEQTEVISIVGIVSSSADEFERFKLPGQFFKDGIAPDLVGTQYAVIAIGDPAVKKQVSEHLRSLGFLFPSFIHPSSVVSSQSVIEEGVIVFPQCSVSGGVNLNKFVTLCSGVHVAHDAVVGPYVQINSGSLLGGFVQVGQGALVGYGVTIDDGAIIEPMAKIASGSVVVS